LSTTRSHRVLLCGIALAVALGIAAAVEAASGERTVVVLVEPQARSNGPAYSLTLEGRESRSLISMLDALSNAGGGRLALLARADLPVGEINEIVALASKAGYDPEAVILFVFDVAKTGIIGIPGYERAPFTTDGAELGALSE
jgi:hypothetical protein